MRIDKMLADCGVGTRSEIKKLIRQKRVLCNGAEVKDAGMKIDPDNAVICIDGRRIVYREFAYYLLNKPKGYICAADSAFSVLELVSEPDRGLFPCGRLDKDTEGLLLITNDGQLAHRLLSPKHHVDKEYEVTLRDEVNEEALAVFREGVIIDGGEKCLPAEYRILDSHHCTLVIREGKYHQVKRMFAAVGNEVTELKRIRMKDLVLDENLKSGTYRPLTEAEIEDLRKHVLEGQED